MAVRLAPAYASECSDVLHRHVKGHRQDSANSRSSHMEAGRDSQHASSSGVPSQESHNDQSSSNVTGSPFWAHAPPLELSGEPPLIGNAPEPTPALANQPTMSNSATIHPWTYSPGQTSHTLDTFPQHSEDCTEFNTDTWLLQGSGPLPSWQPFNFDWNADVPDLTNEISLPDSSSPPLKDATLSLEDPQNRFTQVQHAWRHRSLKQPGQGSIWRCIARSAPPSDSSAQSSDAIFSQSHRVDENCRQRLIGSFNSALASTYLGEGSAPGHLSVEFPSSETLGYALEQYFVYFHPMLPFVHLPTFRVQTTPTPLLLSMCLIGLSVLRNGDSSDFVSGAFEVPQ